MPTVDDVFGVSRDVPLNYVPRRDVDMEFVNALASNKHIVVFGSSKQGKTCMRKYNLLERDYIHVACSNKMTLSNLHSAILKSAGYVISGSTTRTTTGEMKITAKVKGGINFPWLAKAEAETGAEATGNRGVERETIPMELDPGDVNEIISAMDEANCPKYVVLEDFHYLPEETQIDFATALKSFHEDSKYTFVVVGVWLDENRLIQHNGDLLGRVVSVNADYWPADEIRQVISEGENLLNITFSARFKDDLVEGAFDSIWVVQESCRLACQEHGIFENSITHREIDADAQKFIHETIDVSSARYRGFLGSFAEGFMDTELEMYRWLLYGVLTSTVESLESGLSFSPMRKLIDSAHPSAPINAGNLTQALKSTASLQIGKLRIKPIILDFDQTNRRLNVVDRSFLIWLEHQDRNELLELAGLPEMERSSPLR